MKPVPFLQAVYRAFGAGKFDAVGYHPYTYPGMPTDDPGDGPFVTTTPQLHDVMTRHGDARKQVWGTEMGAPTTPTTPPTFQAQYLTRAYSRWDRWSFIGPLIWYAYLDAGTNLTDVEDNLGLVRADFVTKEPAFAAFEKAMRRR